MSTRTKILLAFILLLLAAIIAPNTRALYEGIAFYIRPAIFPDAIKPINRVGRYASLYDLVQLRNADRLRYLRRQLESLNVLVEEIPIPNSQLPSLFVRFNRGAVETIFSAHYDKLYDDPTYQGASDNTAAVSAMLAAVAELAQRGDGGTRAFLFTGEEETGLRGASAFVAYARANGIAPRAIVNFDNLGRGKLTIRPSTDVPGIVFTLPFYGDLGFDGREFRASPPYPRAHAALTQALLRVQPDMVVLERFTAISDSNVFQAHGIPTVAISGDDMRHLDLTWHTYTDRVELLDENNLDRAFDLMTRFP
ncbi:MAG: M20/M25/M40 family metallo-hydrolase [Chloroflexi bacterium]|nr:M20/M25/M40 family metallo-hydrolase [Chloroflexota bacterium]